MANVAQLINRSLKLINALEEGETPTNEVYADSLAALNDMLNEWQDKGISVGNGDLILTDTFPVDESELKAVRYLLAVELAPEFGRDPPQTVYVTADAQYNRLRAKYFKVNEMTLPMSLSSNIPNLTVYDKL